MNRADKDLEQNNDGIILKCNKWRLQRGWSDHHTWGRMRIWRTDYYSIKALSSTGEELSDSQSPPITYPLDGIRSNYINAMIRFDEKDESGPVST